MTNAFWNAASAARALWNASPDAMALTDAAGVVLAANPAYCALHGFSPTDLVGQSLAVTFPEAARPSAMEHYRAVFESRSDPHMYPAAVQWRDERGRFVESRIDFVTQGNRRSSMMSSVRVVAEAATGGSITFDVGDRRVFSQGTEGPSSDVAPLASSPTSTSQTTPEVLIDAIQKWGLEIVLGLPESPGSVGSNLDSPAER